MENSSTFWYLLLGLMLALPVRQAFSESEVYDMIDGKFAPCPPRPNCVSSQSAHPDHSIEPLPYTGDMASAKKALLQVLSGLRGTRIEEDAGAYVHVTFRSRIFRFVDDVEFYFDEGARLVHLKSASRTGYSDLGVNRRRCEMIKEKFASVTTNEAGSADAGNGPDKRGSHENRDPVP